MFHVALDCPFVIALSDILGHIITCEIIYAFTVVSVLSIFIAYYIEIMPNLHV